MNSFQKRQIVAEVNYNNKTYFSYNSKTDTVLDVFNRNARPISFDEWYKLYVKI